MQKAASIIYQPWKNKLKCFWIKRPMTTFFFKLKKKTHNRLQSILYIVKNWKLPFVEFAAFTENQLSISINSIIRLQVTIIGAWQGSSKSNSTYLKHWNNDESSTRKKTVICKCCFFNSFQMQHARVLCCSLNMVEAHLWWEVGTLRPRRTPCAFCWLRWCLMSELEFFFFFFYIFIQKKGMIWFETENYIMYDHSNIITKEECHDLPTTPNTFRISGTKMASRSTSPRMTTVAMMWVSQENGLFPRSSKITALRALKKHQRHISLIEAPQITLTCSTIENAVWKVEKLHWESGLRFMSMSTVYPTPVSDPKSSNADKYW